MKKILFFVAFCLTGMTAHAQQNLSWGQGPQVASPDVHADNTVTFNLQITGDFLPSKKVVFNGATFDAPADPVDLVKNDKGVWSFTTEALKPELYTYNMIVDGVKIIDPLNVYNIRDINNLFSVLLIGGDARTDLYKVNKVAHGTVSKVWYESPTAGLTRRLTPPLATKPVVRNILCFTCCMVSVVMRTPGVNWVVLPRSSTTSSRRVRLSRCSS